MHPGTEQQTALVIGATGLVGSALVHQLLDHPRFYNVTIFSRRASGLIHDRLTEHVINFDEPDLWQHLVQGDVLFSALGTTLNQAGGKPEQYRVDHTYQYAFALAAAKNGVSNYILISSIGASESSAFFYPRMKGELERDIKKLPFRGIGILQPGILEGERAHKRLLENLSVKIIHAINSVGLLKAYRPISGHTVARAMIAASLTDTGRLTTWKGKELFDLARLQAR